MKSYRKETSVTIQDVDRESLKYIKTVRDDPSWAAKEGQLLIPASKLNFISGMRSTWTSMHNFVRGVGVGLTHTEKLLIKKLRIGRETGDLEAEVGYDPKKPDIRRVVESFFNFTNEYSSSMILTDSDFILTNRTCAIAITADMSFRTALAAVREVNELSLPVCDPKRGRLHPRQLHALIHVIFSDTNIQVYLHKKYYLSVG